MSFKYHFVTLKLHHTAWMWSWVLSSRQKSAPLALYLARCANVGPRASMCESVFVCVDINLKTARVCTHTLTQNKCAIEFIMTHACREGEARPDYALHSARSQVHVYYLEKKSCSCVQQARHLATACVIFILGFTSQISRRQMRRRRLRRCRCFRRPLCV